MDYVIYYKIVEILDQIPLNWIIYEYLQSIEETTGIGSRLSESKN